MAWLCFVLEECYGRKKGSPFWAAVLVRKRYGDEAGGNGGGEAPGTMPNPEVKLSSADGTTDVDLWESRELPDLIALRI